MLLFHIKKTKDARETFKLIDQVGNKQTTQWLKKGLTKVHKKQFRKLKLEQYQSHQNMGIILGAPKRVSRSCFICGKCCVAHVSKNRILSQ